ncbi:MAG: hypothetical protein JNL54_08935 [Kineosporiaceae bacterium]|nr:hypothetical protein [Kineosporiaceae bacterium]
MPTLITLAAPAVAAALALSPLAGLTSGDGDASPVASGDTGQWTQDRREQLCGRIGTRIERVQRAQARLSGDATTAGSIARAEARAAEARTAGHEDLARVMDNRAAIRRDLAAALPDILLRLQDSQQVCAR